MTTESQRSESAPLYCACCNCYHAMAEYEVANQADSHCPKCGVGTMRELEVMQIAPPAAGARLLCLVCAYFKEWGIFDQRTGVSVCAECRDKARSIELRGAPPREGTPKSD